MRSWIGVLAAILSSTFGGMSTAVTRYIIHASDPITLAAFRFGLGFVFLLPVALASGARWPRGRDWAGVALLGILFFAIFMSLFNTALQFTTAARGSLALSVLPLLTMVFAALLGVERLSLRKAGGVLIAMGGVALALVAGLANAPSGAWRGDLVMGGAAGCMALYNVWSRPFIVRSSALAFVTTGMGAGAGCVAILAAAKGGFAVVAQFGTAQWLALGYLAAFGAAVTFYLWVFALERTTPTRVATAITVNPIAASILATVLVDEPIGWNLIVGLVAVLAGIWVATGEGRGTQRQAR